MNITTEFPRQGDIIALLEQHDRQPAALGLYRRAGFAEIAPFGHYQPDPPSIFLEKTR